MILAYFIILAAENMEIKLSSKKDVKYAFAVSAVYSAFIYKVSELMQNWLGSTTYIYKYIYIRKTMNANENMNTNISPVLFIFAL